MYEEVTYEEIMTRMLDRVRSEHPEIDTREGSLVYTAIAPCALELAIMYTELDRVLEEVFAETASLEYLEKRTAERGITQRLASNAIMQGKFDVYVPIGTRFSLGDFNYIVIDAIHSYLRCETAGSEANTVLGALTPIDTITGLTSAELVECILPGEDDEDVEDLRARYFDSLGVQAYSFNQKQYREVVNAMDGVGAVKVIPAWSGGGTVKIIILDSNFNPPTDTLVDIVQEALDPRNNQGEGLGLAPIGHNVTVTGAVEQTIDIITYLVYEDGYNWDLVEENVYKAVNDYFLELRKEWETTTNVTIRRAKVISAILTVPGVLDVGALTLNGSTANLSTFGDEVVVLGTIKDNGTN